LRYAKRRREVERRRYRELDVAWIGVALVTFCSNNQNLPFRCGLREGGECELEKIKPI
jgi:hypothetical protein